YRGDCRFVVNFFALREAFTEQCDLRLFEHNPWRLPCPTFVHIFDSLADAVAPCHQRKFFGIIPPKTSVEVWRLDEPVELVSAHRPHILASVREPLSTEMCREPPTHHLNECDR